MSIKQRLFRLYTELVTPTAGEVPFLHRSVPLSDLTVALITTAGVRLMEQAPFDVEHGDPSWRELPGNVDDKLLVPDHTHYDTAPAQADLDCVFPLRTLRLMADQKAIAGVAPVHFGFMGYIPDLVPLVNRSIPEVVQRLQQAQVGAVLLSPG